MREAPQLPGLSTAVSSFRSIQGLVAAYAEFMEDIDGEDIEVLGEQTEKTKSRKKAKQKRRQLIFDEDVGEVVAKRRRKRGREGGDDYDEFF